MARQPSVEKRQEWAERIERFRDSGQTVADFCSAESVSTGSFYHWQRKLRNRPVSAEKSSASRLKPVRLSGSIVAPPAVTIQLAGGMSIEVGADSQILATVLDQVLTRHAVLQQGEVSS